MQEWVEVESGALGLVREFPNGGGDVPLWYEVEETEGALAFMEGTLQEILLPLSVCTVDSTPLELLRRSGRFTYMRLCLFLTGR